MDDDQIYFLSKNLRPSPEKDRIRNACAEYSLSHLKTIGSVMKAVHMEPTLPGFRSKDDKDLTPYVMYTLNKHKRWETEIGVQLMDELRKLNDGWDVLVMERVNLKVYLWNCWNYGSRPERYAEWYFIRKLHRMSDEQGYTVSALDSVFGQNYPHFLDENRMPTKEKNEKDDLNSHNPTVSYNFLTGPKNYVALLHKQYEGRYYGWSGGSCRYHNRIELLKDLQLELRYGEIEDFDEDVSEEEDEEDDLKEKKKLSYNLEDYLVEKFVMVKKRRKRNESTISTDFEIL